MILVSYEQPTHIQTMNAEHFAELNGLVRISRMVLLMTYLGGVNETCPSNEHLDVYFEWLNAFVETHDKYCDRVAPLFREDDLNPLLKT